MQLCRRALLRTLAVGLPGLLLGLAPEPASARRLRSAAEALLPDGRSAEVIAVAFLRAHPREARRARRLPTSLAASGSHDEVVAALRARVRRDFREGDVVWVRGWMLSRTEARLCAFVSLG